jgi:cysteine synthase
MSRNRRGVNVPTTEPDLPTTPLVAVRLDDGPTVWCKLDYLLPSGSTKDRVSRAVLEGAERRGELRPGGIVVEASSGSTGIALAAACALRGYRFVAVMPEGISGERVLAIRAYGGSVALTPRADGIRGAMAEAERRGREPGVFLARQFANPDNPAAHRLGTAREILAALPAAARVGAVVSGVGTGGTLVGLYRGLRDGGHHPFPVLARPVELVGEDAECCSFSGRIPGVVDGLSAIFREADLADLRTVEVTGCEAVAVARRLIRLGFPVGPSSGLNFAAATAVAGAVRKGEVVVTVFPDRMERYFSTELFSPYSVGP